MAIPHSPEDEEKIERLRQAMYSRTLSQQLRPRDRRTLEPNQEIVGDDFVHEEHPLPASTVAPRGMGAVGVMRTALWWLLAIAVIFFICAVGFFVYYFTFGSGANSASPQNIDISVSGPPEVQGGGVTQLQVVVTNRNTVALQLAELVLTYPPGTRAVSDQPPPDNCSSSQIDPTTNEITSQHICLGTIAPGQSQQGEIPVIFSGTAGQQEDVKLEVDYHLAGSNAVFIAPSDYAITFGSSPLSVAVDGNSETISGQPMQFTVTVSSNATAPVKDALMSIAYPFGFTLTSATPAQASPGLWTLGDLDPGQSRSVTLQGTLTGDPGDQRTFQVQAGTRDSATSTSITTSVAGDAYTMNITQSFLGLAISVNSATSTTTVSPGDKVSVTIGYQNNLPTAIQNAVIVASLSGAQIDGSTVLSQNGFYRSDDDAMYWDKTTDPDLASIPAGGSGTLTFTFEAPTSAELQNTSNPDIVMSVSAAGERNDQSDVPQSLQSAVSQTIGIASDLELAAQGLYYANPFGSTGPLPPKANTETTYAIVFSITNTTNEIQDAKLTADLPPYVRWLSSHAPSYENVSYNQDTGEVTWDLGEIAPGVGENGTPPRQAAISIGFTPSTSQIGQEPPLIQNISLTGIDASSSLPVSKTVNDVTTNLLQVQQSSTGMVIVPDPGFSSEGATVVSQ